MTTSVRPESDLDGWTLETPVAAAAAAAVELTGNSSNNNNNHSTKRTNVINSSRLNHQKHQQQQQHAADVRFSCNICFDAVNEPVVTACGHLYCWPCLFQWLEPGLLPHERATLGILPPLQRPLHDASKRVCPVCKAPCSVSRIVPIYVRGNINDNNNSNNNSSLKQEAEIEENISDMEDEEVDDGPEHEQNHEHLKIKY